jgi:hypothetical protein
MESAVDATRLRARSTERKMSRDNKLGEAIDGFGDLLSRSQMHVDDRDEVALVT